MIVVIYFNDYGSETLELTYVRELFWNMRGMLTDD